MHIISYLFLYSCFCFVLYPATGVGAVSIHPKVNSACRLGSHLPEECRSLHLVCLQTRSFLPNKKCVQSFHSLHEDIAKYDLESEQVGMYVHFSEHEYDVMDNLT